MDVTPDKLNIVRRILCEYGMMFKETISYPILPCNMPFYEEAKDADVAKPCDMCCLMKTEDLIKILWCLYNYDVYSTIKDALSICGLYIKGIKCRGYETWLYDTHQELERSFKDDVNLKANLILPRSKDTPWSVSQWWILFLLALVIQSSNNEYKECVIWLFSSPEKKEEIGSSGIIENNKDELNEIINLREDCFQIRGPIGAAMCNALYFTEEYSKKVNVVCTEGLRKLLVDFFRDANKKSGASFKRMHRS